MFYHHTENLQLTFQEEFYSLVKYSTVQLTMVGLILTPEILIYAFQQKVNSK
jgi:hypothetical protein